MRVIFPIVMVSIVCTLSTCTAVAKAEGQSSPRVTIEEVADGFRAIERWRVDEARSIAERALRDLPDHPLTMALVAEVKMHMSDYRGAADLFEKARHSGAPSELLSTAPIAEATRIATDGYEE